MSATTSTASGKTGRTLNGVSFTVPETRDFLENLKMKRHNFFEILTLVVIVIQVLMLFFSGMSKYYYIAIFAIWRIAYNGGIGYLLHTQSRSQLVVRFISKLLAPDSPTMPFFKRHLSMKMGKDYKFETAPMDYNCWLVFRAFVDFILLNDFTAYMVMVFSLIELPSSVGFLDIFCYVLGITLCVFNWFIKMDALRVVKDYAWYWGDFFFLLDGNLTFDGVFQLAPHPMYSIGYIGYYGMSLISRSYIVLYVSLAAHLSQFLFLAYVENPHIDKVYNSIVEESSAIRRRRERLYEGPGAYFRRDLIGLSNLDLFRAADLCTVVIVLYSVLLFCSNMPPWFHVCHCIFWRVFHSAGLGIILRLQSQRKFWTAHFIKYGFSAQDAFANWKSLYNLSMTMTHVSFFFCSLSYYKIPVNIFSGALLLKHTGGLILIALHTWTSFEVWEVIHDFGWFYGDFFVQRSHNKTLSYSGIYRFVNNPEKVMGHAAFYGLALISDSFVIYALALFSQCATFLFIHYVERPHMQKIYGDEVRRRAGFEEAIIAKLKPLKLVQEVERLVDTKARAAFKEVTELVDLAKPRFERFDNLFDDLSKKITRSSVTPSDIDVTSYSLTVDGTEFELGQPIRVKWTAPEGHPVLDWVAIYPHTTTFVPPVTMVSSNGLWQYTGSATEGELVFEKERLPVVPGKYQVRMHYDDHHGVLKYSDVFTIKLGADFKNANSNTYATISELRAHLLTLHRLISQSNEVDCDTPFHQQNLSKDQWKIRAQNIVHFIKAVYDVEFHPRLLDSYPNVAMLACKLHEARISLGAFEGEYSSGDELDEEYEEYAAYYRRNRGQSKAQLLEDKKED